MGTLKGAAKTAVVVLVTLVLLHYAAPAAIKDHTGTV